jgi:hypothetical protein
MWNNYKVYKRFYCYQGVEMSVFLLLAVTLALNSTINCIKDEDE